MIDCINGYHLHFCRICKLKFIDPSQVSDEILNNFYTETYFEATPSFLGRGVGYASYKKDAEIIKRNFTKLLFTIRNEVKEKVNPKSLEIGCAYGYTVKVAQDFGLDSYGIDVFQPAIEYGRNILGLNNLETVSIENYSNSDVGQFDFVFLIGTLEHLRNPVAVLKKCYQLLAPEGTLIVTTVHTDGLLGFCNYKPPEHLFYFTKKSLVSMYRTAGFENPISYSTYFKFYRISEFLRLVASILFFNIKWLTKWGIWSRITMLVPTNEVIITVKK